MPTSLRGISSLRRLPHHDCANAVGAAVAQISGEIDTIVDVSLRTVKDCQNEAEASAIQCAIDAGATKETVSIIQSEVLPITYITNRCRIIVKAAGEWGGEGHVTQPFEVTEDLAFNASRAPRTTKLPEDLNWSADKIKGYRPRVSDGVWTISELDLEFLSIGTCILGCGGSGHDDYGFLVGREILRLGKVIRVIDAESLADEAIIGWGGFMGALEPVLERLTGNE